MISDLVHADLSDEGDPRKMTHAELMSILQQLLVAGNETTAHTLTAGIYFLLKHPAEMEKIKADPSLAGNFVEETLRYLSPTNNMWRVATADTEIGGLAIKKGELILLRYGSANRDDTKFFRSGYIRHQPRQRQGTSRFRRWHTYLPRRAIGAKGNDNRLSNPAGPARRLATGRSQRRSGFSAEHPAARRHEPTRDVQ